MNVVGHILETYNTNVKYKFPVIRKKCKAFYANDNLTYFEALEYLTLGSIMTNFQDHEDEIAKYFGDAIAKFIAVTFTTMPDRLDVMRIGMRMRDELIVMFKLNNQNNIIFEFTITINKSQLLNNEAIGIKIFGKSSNLEVVASNGRRVNYRYNLYNNVLKKLHEICEEFICFVVLKTGVSI